MRDKNPPASFCFRHLLDSKIFLLRFLLPFTSPSLQLLPSLRQFWRSYSKGVHLKLTETTLTLCASDHSLIKHDALGNNVKFQMSTGNTYKAYMITNSACLILIMYRCITYFSSQVLSCLQLILDTHPCCPEDWLCQRMCVHPAWEWSNNSLLLQMALTQ